MLIRTAIRCSSPLRLSRCTRSFEHPRERLPCESYHKSIQPLYALDGEQNRDGCSPRDFVPPSVDFRMLTRVEQELIDRRLFNGADDCAGFFDRFRKSLEIRKRPGASHRHLFLANVLSDRRFSIEGGVAQNKGASLSGSGQGGGPSKRYRRMWWGSTSSMPRIGPEGGRSWRVGRQTRLATFSRRGDS